jgi:hypothetical protein
VSSRLDSGGLAINRFPVILRGRTPALWNIPRVNLDALPILDCGDPQKLEWLSTLAGLSLSDRERLLQKKNHKDVLATLKDNILTLVVAYSGVQSIKSNVFGIHSSVGGVDLVIFVNELRLDPSSSVLVADACILPLTEALISVPVIQQFLATIVDERKMFTVDTEDVTGPAWKQLLPASVERCRTWRHSDRCEYYTKERIPLSLLHSEISICECGRGRRLGAFTKMKDWKNLAPFVTRAAIGPLFPPSYVVVASV